MSLTLRSQRERFDAVVEVKRDVPEGAVVLRGATVITMRGDEVLPNADVVVVNNKIVGVGAQRQRAMSRRRGCA